MRKTVLLPKRVTALPLKNMVSICPMGNASKMLPNAASLKCSVVFISGIRLAQLAKQSPWQKKNTDTAMRICSRGWAGVTMVAVFKMCRKDTKITQNDFVKTNPVSRKRNRFRCMLHSEPVVDLKMSRRNFIYAMDGLKDTAAVFCFLYRYTLEITSTAKNTRGIIATDNGSPLLICPIVAEIKVMPNPA